MRAVRLVGFHLRQFASVPYFIQLMLLTTLAAACVQFVGYTAWGGVSATQGWLRAGIIGMWTTTTSAAGIIGFERYKGTLVYLVMGTMRPQFSLAALVCSAATFGLASFAVAWAMWAALSGSWSFTNFGDAATALSIIGGVLSLYIGSLAVSIVISALFVLTPNAIAYEGMLLVPVMIASGVLMTSQPATGLWRISALLPIATPVRLLYSGCVSVSGALVWIAITALWLGLGYILMGRALQLAYRSGTLELV